jgi:hypothetical protein
VRARRPPAPPPGLNDHVSRRQAAELLGFASEFPIRQLEKGGRLAAVRGAMGQAWYPRAEVLALRTAGARPSPVEPPAADESAGRAHGRWPDDALIALLREMIPAGESGGFRPRTVVDLVADTGVGIPRAVRVHRFWLAHDRHPTAELARRMASAPQPGAELSTGSAPVPSELAVGEPSPPGARPSELAMGEPSPPGARSERRGASRVERDVLIRKLRDPDPAVRALAFEQLRANRP